MPTTSKAADSQDSFTIVGFEVRALRDSATPKSAAIVRWLNIAKDNCWLTAGRGSKKGPTSAAARPLGEHSEATWINPQRQTSLHSHNIVNFFLN